MHFLTHSETIQLLLQIASMLLFARLLGELARKLHQPMVVGEIVAGIVLGPTVLGMLFPEIYQYIMPPEGNAVVALDGIVEVSVVLLLFIAGLEVELDLVLQQGKRAVYTSLFSLGVPFVIGFSFSYIFPDFFGEQEGHQQLILALFIGTILSITALPVIARVLMDLHIFKSNMGMLIIASAMIIDIIGWLIFAVILSMMGTGTSSIGLGKTILLTVGFTILSLTFFKALINRALPWINSNLAWPGGLLSMSIVICLVAAAFTEYIGIHAIFGAFIVGIAMGDSEHMSERAKEIVHQFINNIFAPLFFVSIGITINFITSFNLGLVIILIVLAFIGKVIGGTLGARIGKMKHYQALAIGFGMNTHGTLEIILGAIALNNGLINKELFVAIVIMVLVTILVSAPLMKFCLEQDKKIKKKLKEKLKVNN